MRLADLLQSSYNIERNIRLWNAKRVVIGVVAGLIVGILIGVIIAR